MQTALTLTALLCTKPVTPVNGSPQDLTRRVTSRVTSLPKYLRWLPSKSVLVNMWNFTISTSCNCTVWTYSLVDWISLHAPDRRKDKNGFPIFDHPECVNHTKENLNKKLVNVIATHNTNMSMTICRIYTENTDITLRPPPEPTTLRLPKTGQHGTTQ